MFETSSDLLGKLSKKVDGVYDQANADASKYFSLLAVSFWIVRRLSRLTK
jgi:hypothetical protein